MRIALSREQIHVGRIFTLESRPFPGRSVYVAQKPLGASGNTWSLQRPRENEAEGAAWSRFVPVGTCSQKGNVGNAGRVPWQSCGPGLGSLGACPGFQSRNAEGPSQWAPELRVPAVPKAPVPAVSKKLLLLCVCSFGKHIRVEHTCTGPGRVLERYLIRIYYS